MDEWGFNQWIFTTGMGIVLAIVGFMYRDIRKELHEIQNLVRAFSDFIVQAKEGDKHWESWRADVGHRLNNHSERMNQIGDVGTVSREKITQLEKWRDKSDRNGGGSLRPEGERR